MGGPDVDTAAGWNPTDDELRDIIGSPPLAERFARDLARLVLREREATEKMRSEAWDAVHAWETAAIEWRQRAEKAEAQRDELAEKLRAGIVAKYADIATAREERAAKAEAALARVEAICEAESLISQNVPRTTAAIRAAIAGDPAAAPWRCVDDSCANALEHTFGGRDCLGSK